MRRGAALLLMLVLAACGRDDAAARSVEAALAALRAGDLDRARSLSEQAAAEGGEAYASRRDWLEDVARISAADVRTERTAQAL